MNITKTWFKHDYLNHILKNNLNNIWTGWCNPTSGDTDGLRVSAYTPQFPENGITEFFSEKCGNSKCNGSLVIPQEDIDNRIIYRRVCNGTVNGSKCGRKRSILYRWVSIKDKRKLWFNNNDIVRFYGGLGRSFYATNIIYDKELIKPKYNYTHEQLMKACSLNIDIDIKRGTICDSNNREDLNKCLNILREELDTFAGGSYNLQTSGNGVYIMLHHRLVSVSIRDTMARYNGWINHMNEILVKNNIKRVKLDAINMPSRVFKMIGSMHQKYDLVSIPLDYDCDINKMNSNDFKTKHFNINNFMIDDKLNYYNRFNPYDVKSLYAFLEELDEDRLSGPRALNYNYKESIEVLTGEEIDNVVNEGEEYAKKLDNWIKLDVKISGTVYYKINDDGFDIEMYGVKEDDKKMIRDKVKKIRWG